MIDRDLVKLAKKQDDYKKELFFKYENLCFKHLHILERQLNHAVDIKDDFMADTYEVFLKALETVKLSEIKNDDWLFLGWYGFYLKNLRIKYMKDILKINNNETGLVKTSRDGQEYLITDLLGVYTHDVYQIIEDKITFETIFKSFTERQKKIAKYKGVGYKNNEIAKMLNISNTMITFEIQSMKESVRNSLE